MKNLIWNDVCNWFHGFLLIICDFSDNIIDINHSIIWKSKQRKQATKKEMMSLIKEKSFCALVLKNHISFMAMNETQNHKISLK